DLNNDGVTPNDNLDPDTGPNNLQNFPVLTSATVSGGSTNVTGTLNSTANTSFTLEFFGNMTGTQAESYLGSYGVTTDSNGNVSFTAALSAELGINVTATATDPNNNTSEFSAAVIVGGPLRLDAPPSSEAPRGVTPHPRNTSLSRRKLSSAGPLPEH